MARPASMAGWQKILARARTADRERPQGVRETVIRPRLNGIWPNGELQSVREAADRLAQARRQERPAVPAPRTPAGNREMSAPGMGRSR